MAITQITNDVEHQTADYALRLQRLQDENSELSKNLRDLLEMQVDGPCSETVIMKEHIRVLEERVKELVS